MIYKGILCSKAESQSMCFKFSDSIILCTSGTEATYTLSFQPEGWVNDDSDQVYAEVRII
jgi:hypothetical protein